MVVVLSTMFFSPITDNESPVRVDEHKKKKSKRECVLCLVLFSFIWKYAMDDGGPLSFEFPWFLIVSELPGSLFSSRNRSRYIWVDLVWPNHEELLEERLDHK